MSLRRCLNCTTLYALSLPRCPQCWSDDSIEEGSQMPKITKHGGPSDASLPTPDHEPSEDETPPVVPQPTEPPPTEPSGQDDTTSDEQESGGSDAEESATPPELEPDAPSPFSTSATGTTRRGRTGGTGRRT